MGKADLREFVQHIFSDDALQRIRGGIVREGEKPNVVPVETFMNDRRLRRLISHPSMEQMQTLYAKAQVVGKVRPLEKKLVKAECPAATHMDEDKMKEEDAPSAAAASSAAVGSAAATGPVYIPFHGTSFLVSPRYLATCFHNLFSFDGRKRDVVPSPAEQSIRWPCRSPVRQFSVRFPLLQDPTSAAATGLEIFFDASSIRYGPLVEHGNHRNVDSTIWYDCVLVRLDDDTTAKLDALVNPACFIPLFSLSNAHPGMSTSGPVLLEPFIQQTKAQQTLFIIGFPEDADQTVDEGLVISMRDNTIQGFWEWEVLYSTPTARGMSGAPGLLADGALAVMHRRRGPEKNVSARVKSLYGEQSGSVCNYGLSIDLLLRDEGFDAQPQAPPPNAYERRFGAIGVPPATNEQLIWKELHDWYATECAYPPV